jgi:hypothetical protein
MGQASLDASDESRPLFTKSRSLTRTELATGKLGASTLRGEDEDEDDDGDEAKGPPSWHPGQPSRRISFGGPRTQFISSSDTGCPYCLSKRCFGDTDMPPCLEKSWRDVLTKLKTNETTSLDLRGGVRSISKETDAYGKSDDIERFKIGDYVQRVHELADALKSKQ